MPRGARIAAVPAAAVALVLVAGQLLLPRLAASRIRSRLARYGAVGHVSVSAWPALELLWGRADTVRVRAARLSMSTAQAAALLTEASGLDRVTLSVRSLRVGSLALSDVSLNKRGALVAAGATASQSAVDALVPGLSLRLVSGRGGAITARLTGHRAGGGPLGLQGPVEVVAAAVGGRLVARTLPLSVAGARVTLFASPHVAVTAVGASVTRPPAREATYRLTAAARIH
jgi:hypothetical protein